MRYLRKGIYYSNLCFTLNIKIFTVQYVQNCACIYRYSIYMFTTGKALTNIDFSMLGGESEIR